MTSSLVMPSRAFPTRSHGKSRLVVPVRDPLRLAGGTGTVQHVCEIVGSGLISVTQSVTRDGIFHRTVIVTDNLPDLVADKGV